MLPETLCTQLFGVTAEEYYALDSLEAEALMKDTQSQILQSAYVRFIANANETKITLRFNASQTSRFSSSGLIWQDGGGNRKSQQEPYCNAQAKLDR
jgi:hypothetical protein